ncbi:MULTISPECIES: phospholipid carrier-dependent glycosyltransferase [unclassified Pseudomonas]|uniref:ArnT family glycosyltransferase n=1 Tax=unclassified Pseudomonas TaxID=196821 RepID=UPI000D38FD1B|nr:MULTISPECIES: phospholipid carrier-dependent glycosyltransferase [unclassified Pseudomonas]RAU48173.1 phospholipid carrier-dependent glycosyltransferase [Pseudomonas sp. RIT 409]RAU55529.1 phospholipid carrier-dependent glycosyltransferase [Pseudomonas sp. RIT 412]
MAASWHLSIIGFDSRFVLFAQEMLRHGPSAFPTTYGAPYPDYSGFSTWLIYLFSLPFGEVTSFCAWLPTCIASAVTVGLMYRLLAPYSRRWAWLSIALLLLSNTFITETRAVSLDQMLATVSFSAFYLAYAHDHFAARRRLGWMLGLLVLGFAIRGPIGLVVPAGVLCSYYLLSRQWRRLATFAATALGLLIACMALLLLLAWFSGGPAFFDEVIRMQITSRLDGSEGASPLLWYFGSSLGNYALAYPLALAVMGIVLLSGRRSPSEARSLVYLCAFAGLTVMVGLSIPQAKKARYILPMLPLAAVVAAYPFQVRAGRAYAWMRGVILTLCCFIPGALLAGLLAVRPRFPEGLSDIGPVLTALGLLQLIALPLLMRPRLRLYGLPACAVLAVWIGYIGVFEKAERILYDTRHFTQAVRDVTRSEHSPLVLHGMGRDAKGIKFMVNVDEDLQPVFTETPEQLQAIAGPAYVVMSNNDLQQLQGTFFAELPVLLSGRFDKEDYVLLRVPGR